MFRLHLRFDLLMLGLMQVVEKLYRQNNQVVVKYAASVEFIYSDNLYIILLSSSTLSLETSFLS